MNVFVLIYVCYVCTVFVFEIKLPYMCLQHRSDNPNADIYRNE